MAGLRACREKMPDLIFFDWNLPSMKGVEFIKSVRGQQDGGHPVILFCTTESDAGEIASAMAAGANEYVHEAVRPRPPCAPSWRTSASPL